MTEGKHKPKEVHLVSPTDEDLDRAYRSLCSGHRITVRMKSHELWEILLKMENRS